MPPAIHGATVEHPSAWYGRDLERDRSWLIQFTAADLDEIDRALHEVRAAGLSLGQIGRSSFRLPTLEKKLAAWLEEIRTGRGFVVLRGLPVTRYSDEEVGLIFWGLGAYLGTPVTQNPRGDLLGHVFDHGRTYGDMDVRGYETKAHLPFHSDGCDLVGLLCLRRAKSGGLSSVVSSVTIHNEILQHHPEYLEPLYRGFHYIRREAALTDSPVAPHRVPVFGAKDGLVSSRLIRNQINAAFAKTATAPTSLELDALDMVDRIAQDPDIHLDMDLQLGDIQLCNNYTVRTRKRWHSRSRRWPKHSSKS